MGSGKVLLGIRWDASSWEQAPRLVDRVLQSFRDVPLHWVLPSLPCDGSRQPRVVSVLRRRLDAGDVLLSAGFSGAFHPLLSPNELEREVAWGIHNPWSTGLGQALGARPVAMVPWWADLDRPEAARIYLKHGLGTVGVSGDRSFAFAAANGLRVFPCVRYPRLGASKGSETALGWRVRGLLLRHSKLFVLVDLDRISREPESSERVLESLARLLLGSRRPFARLPDHDREAGGEPTPTRGEPVSTGELRRRLDMAAHLRSKKRPSSADTRTLLSVLAPCSPVPDPAPYAPPRLSERGLIAHMQGEAILSGRRFDLGLAGGRFCGLRDRGGPLTPPRPVASWLRVGRKLVRFRGQTAFSFEDSAEVGLREELVLESGGQGSIVVDYAFRGDDPRLWIEGTVTLGDIGPAVTVEESALFALTIAEVGRGAGAVVEVETPDGSRRTCPISSASGWQLLAGSAFRVPTHRGTAVLADGGKRRHPGWTVLLFRVAAGAGRRRYLEASPVGCAGPLPAARLAGLERFSLTVDFED